VLGLAAGLVCPPAAARGETASGPGTPAPVQVPAPGRTPAAAPPRAADDADTLVRNRLHLATEYARERRWEEALDLYRQVYRTHPDHPKMLRGMKNCLLELKQYEELLQVLRRELEITPAHPALLEELGTVYAQMGDRVAAAQAWRRIVEIQQGSRGSYSMVADLMTRNRMLDEALEIYAEADSVHAGSFTRQKAALHELRFEFDQATDEYLAYLESSPTGLSAVEGRLLRIGEAEESLEPVIRRVERRMRARSGSAGGSGTGSSGGDRTMDIVYRKLLGDLYLEAGDHERAREQYFLLVDEAPQQASSLLVFGKRCQTDGRHEVAIRVFERIVSEYPDARAVPSALTEIALSEAELGHWDDAIGTYDRLITDWPETDYALVARYRKAVLLRDGQGKPEEAEGIFRELITRVEGPWGEADPQFELAECALWRGDLERARGIYASIGERRFSEATKERALYEQARAEFYAAEFAVSDSLFKEVAQKYPRGAHVNDALAFSILINTNPDGADVLGPYAQSRLALRTNRPEEAIKLLDELVRANAGAAIADEALLLAGTAQRELGEPQRALAVLERAATEAQVPDLAAEARLLRARIFAEDLGDRAQALAEYEELLVAFPETLAADRARDLAAQLTRMLP
jgi:tetratricopeptide (TPR) repeat protein